MKHISLSLALFVSCAAVAAAGPLSAKERERVIYTFKGTNDGVYPGSRLIWDDAGNMYGSTLTSVFRVTPRGAFKSLHVFQNGPAGDVANGVIRDDEGNIYGTTRYHGEGGQGTVYRLAPDGTLSVLHGFTGSGGDGANPCAELVRDASGNLYGTTNRGGAHNAGIVFKIAPDGAETILHTFADGDDGGYPVAGLILGADGTLFGATQTGAHQMGNIFKITPDGQEIVLHAFEGPDGELPWATPVMDGDGNLYGTTVGGGEHNKGAVFRLSSRGNFKVLYSFTGGADGSGLQGGIIRDADGNLYGGTYEGGAFNKGTVFKITPKGKESVLYSFTGGQDGWNPSAAPLSDSNGHLYGTTGYGGSCAGSTNGCGVVFRVKE